VAVPASPPPNRPERAALSRDLGDFLIELSIALHKHALYPPDHPSLDPAAEAVVDRAELLLVDRTTLALGVARNQLVIEGVATDPKHPVLRELADRLHRHHLGAVTFSRGVSVSEVRDALRTLAMEADRTGQPLGLGPLEALRRWEHLRLHPLTYERLELVDEAPAPDVATGTTRNRAAQLWVGLARAALATEGSDEAPASNDPAVIARAIDERVPHSAGAYDQAIVGYMLQIAEELKAAGSNEAVALRRRMSRLVRGLKPQTLQRLVAMGGDFAQRHKFVADATDGMALDAVLEIVQAAATTSNQTISHALVRMLSKFAAHAEAGSVEARPQADAALRQQVRQLLEGWSLKDPNPGAYGAALQRMAKATPLFAVPVEEAYPTEPERIAAMGLELDIDAPPVLEAVDRVVSEGRVLQLLEVLEEMPTTSMAADKMWERVGTQGVVRLLATQDPPDFKTLDRLASRVGASAAEPLLDALAMAESRGARRGFLGLLVRLGPAIAPVIVSRLEDSRWYVTRNLLSLLEEIGDLPATFDPTPWLGHSDPRVRLQALKVHLKLPVDHAGALITAIQDADQKVVRLALTTVHHGCPGAVVPYVVRWAADGAASPELRELAIRALGGTKAPAARDALLDLTQGGRTLLGREKLPPKSAVLVAALRALAAGWANIAVARRVLARAAASPDPDIRSAAAPPAATAPPPEPA
jgi:hypothetical protein